MAAMLSVNANSHLHEPNVHEPDVHEPDVHKLDVQLFRGRLLQHQLTVTMMAKFR